jgi:hypothetical protein
VDDLVNFLEAVFWKAPLCLTLFAATIFVISRWERHPLVSLWAALGLGWMLLVILAEVAWRVFLVPDLFPDPGPPTCLGESLSYVGFSILESMGLCVVVAAVLLGRRTSRHPFQSDHDDDFDDHGRR